jgi:hypothetical protein
MSARNGKERTVAPTPEGTESIQRGIEQTRADMSSKIAALESRLSPSILRRKVGIELEQVEARVQALVRTELVEAKSLLRTEISEVEQKVKMGLGEARETVKKDVQDALVGARQSIRAATLGKVEDFATTVGDKMNETRETLVDTIRNNPVPAAIAGVGLAWLFMNRSSSARRIRSAQWRRPDFGDFTPYGSPDARVPEGGNVGRRNGLDVGGAMNQATEAVGQGFEQARDVVGAGVNRASDAAKGALQGAMEAGSTAVRKTRETASQLAHQASDTASLVANRAEEGAHWVEQGLQRTLEQSPMAFGAAALAAGAMIGFSLPRTPGEDAMMGAARDSVLERAGEAVHAAAASVADLAGKGAETAKGQAKETEHSK